MDDVAHLVPLPDADHVPEVVRDDPEVVPVVIDVGREERAIAPSENDLLAPVRCAPIDFHVELVALHEAGWLAQPLLADLRQEEHESARPRPVARERGVRLRLGAAGSPARDEVERLR